MKNTYKVVWRQYQYPVGGLSSTGGWIEYDEKFHANSYTAYPDHVVFHDERGRTLHTAYGPISVKCLRQVSE